MNTHIDDLLFYKRWLPKNKDTCILELCCGTGRLTIPIAQEGYDPQFGARPVKRVIQRNLLNDLSKQILAEKVTKDNQILVDVKNDHIVFTNK